MESGMTYPPALIATGPLKGVTSRKLIRSRSVAAEPVSGTEKEQARSVNRMLKAQATALVTHFESALGHYQAAQACRKDFHALALQIAKRCEVDIP